METMASKRKSPDSDEQENDAVHVFSPGVFQLHRATGQSPFDFGSSILPLDDSSGKPFTEWMEKNILYVELVDYARQLTHAIDFMEDRQLARTFLHPSKIQLFRPYEGLTFLALKICDRPHGSSNQTLQDSAPVARSCFMKTEAPVYVPPETSAHSAVMDSRADVWIMGAIIHNSMFHSNECNLENECRQVGTSGSLLCLHRSFRPVLHQGMDSNLAQFLPCCLKKDPSHRSLAKDLLNSSFLKNDLSVNGILSSSLREEFLDLCRQRQRGSSYRSFSDANAGSYSGGEIIYQCACTKLKGVSSGAGYRAENEITQEFLDKTLDSLRPKQPREIESVFHRMADNHGKVFRFLSNCVHMTSFLLAFAEQVTNLHFYVRNTPFDLFTNGPGMPLLRDLNLIWLCDEPVPDLNLNIYSGLNCLNLYLPLPNQQYSMPIISDSLAMLFIPSDSQMKFSSCCFRSWRLPKLTYLNIWNCHVAELDGISDATLPSLTTLDIFWSLFEPAGKFSLVHSKLERVEMKDCGPLNAADFDAIDLPGLKYFGIEDQINFQRKKPLEESQFHKGRINLPLLEYVDMRPCHFDVDKLDIDLTSFPCMKRIYVGLRTTASSFTVSVSSPSMTALWLNFESDHECPIRLKSSNVPLVEEVLIELAHDLILKSKDFGNDSFPKLNELKLYDCSFDRSTGFRIRNDCLTTLNINVCPNFELHDEGLVELPNLDKLWLEDCEKVQITKDSLKEMPKLRYFVMKSCKVMVLEENCFSRTPELKWIWISPGPGHDVNDCTTTGTVRETNYSWLEDFLSSVSDLNNGPEAEKEIFLKWMAHHSHEWSAQSPASLRHALECSAD